MKSALVLVALTLAFLNIQQSPAAQVTILIQAINNDGTSGSTVIQRTTNSPLGTVSDSASLGHVQDSSSASFGYLFLAINSNDHVEPDPTQRSDFGSIAYVTAGWNDTITIHNSSLDGTAGYLRPSILYSGRLSATCDADAEGASSDIALSLSGSWDYFSAGDQFHQGNAISANGQVDAHPSNSPQTVNFSLDAAGLAASNGLPNLDIPFVYGQRFDLIFSLMLSSADVGGAVNWTQNQHGTLKLQWQGAQVLDANSNQVSNFTLTSESGTDWSRSQGVTGAVLQIASINVTNVTNVVINGTNGTPFNQVILRGSPDPVLAMTNWAYLDTNSFDLNGNVSFTNAISTQQFYFRLMSN